MRRLRRNNRGQAVVEFALILPLFLLLVFAITEFGRVWMVQQVLTNASRLGVRRAILPSTTVTEVEQAVNSFCQAASLDLGALNISSSNVGVQGTSGIASEVAVTYTHQILSGSIVPGFQGSISLSSITRMRHE